MNIQLHEITICDLVAGCHDDGNGGVVGYGGFTTVPQQLDKWTGFVNNQDGR